MYASDSIVKSIRKTLAYFDLVDFPLTREELFSFLWEPPQITYDQFLLFLPKFIQQKILVEAMGYYVLPGREQLIELRRRRLLVSEKKITIARRAARIIRSVPFLKAVFVCNTVASEQATEDSDIDFFIIAKKNRIWLVRLFVTLLLEIFRLRRVGARIKDKICLSFYITEDNLDLRNLRAVEDDIHLAYWLNQMLPIFDPEQVYQKFLEVNMWSKKYLPHINSVTSGSYIFSVSPTNLSSFWKKMWEKMWQGSYGDIINNEAKKIQLSKMSRSQFGLKSRMFDFAEAKSAKFSGHSPEARDNKNVVISDAVLKFHEKDTRLEYREKWLQKCRELEGGI